MTYKTTLEPPSLVEKTMEIYSHDYLRYKSDSPDQSRNSMLRRLGRHARSFGKEDLVLDLGAGRQVLEKQYIGSRGGDMPFQIMTVDIAQLTKGQLLARRYKVPHIRANGEQLPFPNNAFSLVISNMALDFMPQTARNEVYRVVSPQRYVLLSLHHPTLIPENLDELIRREEMTRLSDVASKRDFGGSKAPEVLYFWKYLRDNNILFHSRDDIADSFIGIGFIVERVEEVTDPHDIWWEVDLYKP